MWRALTALSDRCQRLLRILMASPPPSYGAVAVALDMPVGSIGPSRQRCLERLRGWSPARARCWGSGWTENRHERGRHHPVTNDDLGDDDALLARLGAIAGTVDPVPEIVTRSGYAALSTRRLDEELAELLMDSDLVEAGRLRAAGDQTRVLSFASETMSLELQVEGDGEQKALRGFASGVTGDIRIACGESAADSRIVPRGR